MVKTVNVVTGFALDWVFSDLVGRLFLHLARPLYSVNVTTTPKPGAVVYHYWRPQAAAQVDDLSRAVLHCHGLGYWKEGHPIYGPEVMAAFTRARAVVCLNSGDKAVLTEAGCASEDVYVIPHAVDSDVFCIRPTHDPTARLCIGRVGRPYAPPDHCTDGVECKGLGTMRRVGEVLAKEHNGARRFRWLFLGDGWDTEASYMRGLGYEAEYIARSAVGYPMGFIDAYHQMDVYIVTSRAEGGPASLPEAMACGVWPVCTDVGMCADLLTDELGNLVPVNDVERMVGVLDTWEHEAPRKILDQARMELWLRVHAWTWPKWAEAHAAVYDLITSEQ